MPNNTQPRERQRLASRYLEARERLAAFCLAAVVARHPQTLAIVDVPEPLPGAGDQRDLLLSDVQTLVDVVEILQPTPAVSCALVPRPPHMTPKATSLAIMRLGSNVAVRLAGGRWAVAVKVHAGGRDIWRIGGVSVTSSALAAASSELVILTMDEVPAQREAGDDG